MSNSLKYHVGINIVWSLASWSHSESHPDKNRKWHLHRP